MQITQTTFRIMIDGELREVYATNDFIIFMFVINTYCNIPTNINIS